MKTKIDVAFSYTGFEMRKSFYVWPTKACYKIKPTLFLMLVCKVQFAVRKGQSQ